MAARAGSARKLGVPWNKRVADVDALILLSQNEIIEQLSEEDRPL
jgi:hypothetical protein